MKIYNPHTNFNRKKEGKKKTTRRKVNRWNKK